MRRKRRITIVLVSLLASAIFGTAAVAAGTSKSKQHPAAALDSSFGKAGTVALGRGYQIYGAATQPDAKVVVGDRQSRAGVRLVVARLTAAGRLDPSFNHGHVELGPPQKSGGSIGRAVAIQHDGNILVAGVLTDRTAVAQDGMLVERFTKNGGLDRRFGSAGTATLLPGTGQSATAALAVQGDGKIIVAGNGPGSDGLPHMALARLDTRGRPDLGFAVKGVRIADGSQDLGREGTAAAVALQAGGKIVIAGSARPDLQVSNAVVARFTSRGQLDRSFGSAGSFVVPGAVEGGAEAVFRAVSLATDGGIVAAGAATSDGATPAFALAVRLSNNGHPVSSFGRRGIVALGSDHGSTPSSALPGANATALARGGAVVLAGSFADSGMTEVALWSLNPHGSVINAGSTRTLLSTSLGAGSANALAIDPMGRLVVAGASNNFVAFNGLVLRYRGFGR
jgi:uncharacterized delta-60 repeat protein